MADGDPFGGLTQEQLSALMEADARRVWGERAPGRSHRNGLAERHAERPADPMAPHRNPVPMYGDNGYDLGMNQAMGAFNYAGVEHARQGNQLQGMANDVMSVIQRENDSRVAQAREQRRMQHEKDMEQMRINALLQRLEMESRNRQVDSGSMGFDFDPTTRKWNRW